MNKIRDAQYQTTYVDEIECKCHANDFEGNSNVSRCIMESKSYALNST